MAKPWREEVRLEALRLIQLGHKLPDVGEKLVKKFGSAPHKGTLSKWAKEAGIATVATEATRVATEARSVQCEAKRMDLKLWRLEATEKLAVKANRYIERLDEPHIVYSIGGKDNIYTQEVLDEPTPEAAKALMGVIKDVMQRVDKIVDAEDMTGATAAVSLLSAFAEQLGIGVMQDDDDDEEDTFDDEESSDEEAGNYSEE